jgi:hypothetical protein
MVTITNENDGVRGAAATVSGSRSRLPVVRQWSV